MSAIIMLFGLQEHQETYEDIGHEGLGHHMDATWLMKASGAQRHI